MAKKKTTIEIPLVPVPPMQGATIIEELDKRIKQLTEMLCSREYWQEKLKTLEGRLADMKAATAQNQSVIEGKNADTRAAILNGLLSMDEGYQIILAEAQQARRELVDREINLETLRNIISARKLEARLLIATLEVAAQ